MLKISEKLIVDFFVFPRQSSFKRKSFKENIKMGSNASVEDIQTAVP